MTPDDLGRLIEQYRAGIVAELNILRQLAEVAQRQREATARGELSRFGATADARDALMRSLVMIEEGLRGVRQSLTADREIASQLPGYDDVAALHHEAAQMVSTILATDQESLSSLADAELARRSAFANLERGETTLAAYRRVLAPPVASATILNRRG